MATQLPPEHEDRPDIGEYFFNHTNKNQSMRIIEVFQPCKACEAGWFIRGEDGLRYVVRQTREGSWVSTLKIERGNLVRS